MICSHSAASTFMRSGTTVGVPVHPKWCRLALKSADMCCSIRPTLRGLHSTGGVLVLGGPLVPQTVT